MKSVLVAPLNWGLGHATRCIPVINELLKQGAEVFIASDGNALQFLKLEFPKLTFFELPSYNITYGSGNDLIFKMPAIFLNTKKAIAEEHEALAKIITAQHFDLIISDNRYGIWNAKIHSVFITHQINIQVPDYIKWMQPLLLNYNLKQISNFNECWIPDNEGEENLSGSLSHQCKLPDNTYYIGILSRFFKRQLSLAPCPLPLNSYQLLILLSGPEPQRTIFEKSILNQLQQVKYQTLVVQGLAQQQEVKQLSENVTLISYLTTNDLHQYIAAADIVVSRSGYSTIMDLAAINGNALLVPTPGQTEQEYLAKKFNESGVFYTVKQTDFKITNIEKAKTFSGLNYKNNSDVLQTRISMLLR